MPTYDYKCEACGEMEEHIQSIKDKPFTWCLKCGKFTLKRVFSPPGVIFNGPGYYKTDNRREK